MDAVTEPRMGRFSVEVELVNDKDLAQAEDGLIPQEQVRRARVRGVVESGAARLVVPESIARQLGLKTLGTARVRCADGRLAERSIAQRVRHSSQQ